MVKPGGSVCNLDCRYCFYLEKEALYPERRQTWRMSDETLELYIRQHIEAQPGHHVLFAWQGGEPTMMGLPFFRRVIELCRKYGEGRQIQHALQTNGMLINSEWASFLAQHHFLVGISVDGPAHLHDLYRVNRAGEGSHSRVMAALALLRAHGVEFNTLTVVGRHNADHALDVYDFLLSAGSRYIQFIPLVERLGSQSNSVLKLVLPEEGDASLAPWSVPSWLYGEFLRQIFATWVRRDVGRVSVQMFDVAMSAWNGLAPVLCVHSETCGHALALESNGDLYNCDHFVYPQHLLGNIHQQSVRELNASEQAIRFGEAKRDTLTPDCLQCQYRFACQGGCPKHRFVVSPGGYPGHNYLCAGYKHFFKQIAREMNIMRDLLAAGYQAEDIMSVLEQENRSLKNIERNDPCPCGSRKKFKKCCGRSLIIGE